jgi:methionyl-tRNA formyltransferase
LETPGASGKYPRTLLLCQHAGRPFQKAIARGILDGGGDLVAIVEPCKGHAVESQLRKRRLARAIRDRWHPGMVRRLRLTHDVHETAFADLLKHLCVDLMVVSRWHIIRPEVFRIPSLGTLNTHVSLLPELRGPSPVEGALIAGLGRTGVTIHHMDDGIDTGDIVLQRQLPIETGDTAIEVQHKAAKLMRVMYAEVIRRIRSGTVEAQPQNSYGSSYFSWRKCFGSDPEAVLAIDWNAPGWLIQRAAKIQRCHTTWNNRTFRLVEPRLCQKGATGVPGEIVSINRHSVVVATGEGNIATGIDSERGIWSGQIPRSRSIPPVGERFNSSSWPGWERFTSWAVAPGSAHRRNNG